MESIYHIVAIRVNETSWAHVWRLRFCYLETGYDMDQLIKVAHFIPVKTTYSRPQLAELYMSRIVCLHGVPKKIVSDRGTQFTSRFWERLREALDTQLRFSSAYHP
jgi:transposase InsO family protein